MLGTFAIYHAQPRSPSVDQSISPSVNDIKWIETEARLAALATEKDQDRTRLDLAARGVETIAHGQLLLAQDCELAQTRA